MRPLARQVPKRDAKVILLSVPCPERVPPLILRLVTRCRRLRSASLLSEGTAGAGQPVPAFPQARYFVQRTSWENASNANDQRCFLHQRMENLLPVANLEQFEMLDGDSEVFPGLNVIVTDGHTKEHQMVMFNHGGERVVFLGDLVPTPYHLNPAVISAFDHSPQDTFEQKREILADAERQGWLLVFSHGHKTKAGYLERRGDITCLRPVNF